MALCLSRRTKQHQERSLALFHSFFASVQTTVLPFNASPCLYSEAAHRTCREGQLLGLEQYVLLVAGCTTLYFLLVRNRLHHPGLI